jgi:hypothetical protein
VSAADVVQEPVAGAAPAAAAAGPRPPPPPPPLPGAAFVLLPGCYFFARDCGSICCLPLFDGDHVAASNPPYQYKAASHPPYKYKYVR